LLLYSAGVAGLTTALLLSRNDQYNVKVLAKHMPGDYDIEYASPWAGANYLPYVVRVFSLLASHGIPYGTWDSFFQPQKPDYPSIRFLKADR
jgi:glycine/D-amino acid oxidase-like deaminating enzyme